MNSFPANAIPQFPGHPHMAGFPPGAGGPGVPPPGVPGMPPGQHLPPGMQPPAGMPMEAHLAMIQQQQANYLAQQQQLAAMGHQQLAMRQAAAPATGKKGKKQARAAQAQVLPRHMAAMAPPHGNEHYIKNAMVPPQGVDVIDPWADQLDELDPRELAMSRYRARNEMMAEVFGPEPIKDVPDIRTDPWQGLGLNGETLEAKVLALEASNAELEEKFDSELEAFRKRLETISNEGTAAA